MSVVLIGVLLRKNEHMAIEDHRFQQPQQFLRFRKRALNSSSWDNIQGGIPGNLFKKIHYEASSHYTMV